MGAVTFTPAGTMRAPETRRFAEYAPRDHAPDAPGPRMDPSPVTVRLAEPRDARAMARIQTAWRDGHPPTIARRLRREMRRVRAQGAGELWVATWGTRVIAYARVRYFVPAPDAPANTVPEGWYLLGVAVSARYRRRGVARALVAARLAWLAERSDIAYTFIHAANQASLALVEPFGFRRVSDDIAYPRFAFRPGEAVLESIDLRARVPGEASCVR